MSRTILITGAAKGIGRAVAEDFAANGDNHLILLDLDLPQLQGWVDEQQERIKARVETHAANIADLPAMEAFFKQLGTQVRQVDVLVNSAGICNENEPEDLHNWHKVISVNLNGTFYVTSLCLALIPDRGRIINMSSILGRAGKVRNTAYCASKHGIVGMTKALALDLASRQITVNAILPAWIDTPMLQGELATQAAIAGLTQEQIVRNAKKKLPMRRFIQSEEVAAMVRYLASPEAGGVTAQSLVIDGGVGLGM
ncbi:MULTISPECIES: SDR family NAD(P)-dependent oxidoreductase [unclassified Pseudomonas]|jgi:3-hydroxybutyrate dehydrogenase|uniref:SDR family NAD(P)-dependent oxidoreductase n=1 Tax=unclassified Pseudomonas TaxID=196821 RepID=UPI000C824B67|nr:MULTISPECIES: SDR family NAD(P)-dependent oxidoreductase [unclassified Pseudomonas]MDX9672679.1 SDR family NAD(P)-dependent oxidoreductase [Pseudomonas sp. P8_250]PMQ08885.1 D-beta-hydroxybutyrate dehydrogenase [Pseudomonas sp. AD21]WPN33379.1 SDR family NAD(P)-dependent oxidoreductase [Pseudomonas sp. P8_139]WPN39435.1 SDR family NAD(P)-dependent oxidoreductase [Pseudomonas sp. P8_229]